MASIERRKTKAGDPRYDVRYRTPSGATRTKTFRTRRDADKFASTTESDKARGDWIDPALARETFREYAERWRGRQMHRPSTAAQLENHLRRHVYPFFGDLRIGSIRPSDVQAWIKGRAEVLAPATVTVVYRWTSSIFGAAVRD